MHTTRSIMVAIAVAVAGSIAITSPTTATEAAKEVVATSQMGILKVDGTLTAGGSVDYSFYFNTVTNGQLLVTGLIASANKAQKWSVKLPALTNTLVAGTTRITGPTVAVPTNFTGKAVMTVTVKFKGRNVATRSVNFEIGAAAPVVVANSVSTNLYEVGFENAITLSSGMVSTYGMGSTPTYKWTQTSGKTVVLTGTNTAAATFTTDALTNFVDFATNVISYSDSQTLGTNIYRLASSADDVLVIVTNKLAQVVSMDAEQTTAATYGFKVLVSGNSITRTGLFTVACATPTPGQPNMPVGTLVSFKRSQVSTNWWLIAAPANSAVVLVHSNSLMPQLRTDVEGTYIIQDKVTGVIITNTAASWTGYKFCAICHGPDNNVNQEDVVTPWSKTKHASFFQKAIDGLESSHYSSSCIQCHTVGYNLAPGANNGGFDDVARQLGWKFPSVLTNGNYAAMPDALKNLANIQCESCHGPGSRHPGSPSISMDVKVCSQCHQDGHNHYRPEQWSNSFHAGKPFTDADGSRGYTTVANSQGMNSQCSRCHSPIGFEKMAEVGTPYGATTNSIPVGNGPLVCQACHDPHDTFDNPDRHQLRVYDTVMFGNPYFRSNNVYVAMGGSITVNDPQLTNGNFNLVITNAGASAACMTCHNGRQLPTQSIIYGTNTVLSAKTPRPQTTGVTRYYQTGNTHDSTVGEVFTGVGAYDYGQVMGNSFHTYLADCQSCHMYQLKVGDTILTNDTKVVITAANLANFNRLVGDHTFLMSSTAINGTPTNVIDNIAACNQCHNSFEPVESFDFKPSNAHDYDGDGVVAGVQTEVQGLLDNLAYLVQKTGVTITISTNAVERPGIHPSAISTSAGYAAPGTAIAEAQYKAAWNWLVCKNEGSRGVHNTQFSVRLLQSSFTDLSTNYYGSSSTNTFQGKFPKAYLR